jgi:DNA-binding response OmpR family regulator
MLFGKKKRTIARLLVVEDEPLVAFDTEHFLKDEGFEIVATVDSVADALAAIADDDDIDLVLADINLADGSGVEVARAAQARGVPVLFVTGNCPSDARALAVGCLAKPYPQRDLLTAIAALEAVREGRPLKRLPGGLSLFGPVA